MYQYVAVLTLQTDSSLHHCRCENSNVRKIWGCQGSVHDNSNLLGYDAMQVGTVIWQFARVFLDPEYGSKKLLSHISNYTHFYMAPCSWRLYNDLSKIILKLICHFNSFWCNRITLQEVKFIYWHQFKKNSFLCCNNTYFDVILCPFWTDTLIRF
jgi:hypothetical protein